MESLKVEIKFLFSNKKNLVLSYFLLDFICRFLKIH